MKRHLALLTMICGGVAGHCAWADGVVTESNLVLNLDSDQTSLVAREPVKLKAVFENMGPDTVRMMPAEELGSNMIYMYYQVMEPGGTSVKRYHSFAFIDRIIDPNFSGEPLAPGERIELFFYPALSRSMRGEPPRNGFTFGEPGQYKVRLAYVPPAIYHRLWRPTDGVVLSNEVTITIRAGTSAENEILDAYWSAGRADLAMGDDTFYIGINEAGLRRVLEKYPHDPLSNFVRFNLAKGRLAKAISDPEGIRLLEGLLGENFRFEEVRSTLAGVYSTNGQRDRALSILFAAIAARPNLLDNNLFMQRVIVTDLGRTGDPLLKWEMERFAGQRRRFAGAAIPPELLRKQ